MRTDMIGVLLCAVSACAAAAQPPAVAYPDGYRDWHHVKSMVINPGHPLYGSFGGIHHLYANKPALQGYRTGHFPDGSVIVFDLLEAHAADGAVTEGPRKVVGVMYRHARKYPATGGWGFEAFKGDSRRERAVGSDAAAACYQCHTQRKDHDFVFSSARP